MNQEDVDLLSAQSLVALCAIEALIATHPRPDEVRQVFNQVYGQTIAGMLASGLTPAGADMARAFAEKLFAPPEKPP